ncbi:MAG: nucleotidyltransferase domain-containing protein [Verrucomicrobia bacterium]|nr:nucleotidyltransferase domain-containing protein [Verrucomicrobiota bacterium]
MNALVSDPIRNLDRLHLPPSRRDAREQLERMIHALISDYGAEKIIAFGSIVHGDVTEHSDIDLCIVRDHPPTCTHPSLEAGMILSKLKTTLSKDLLVRTPRQMKEAEAAPFGVMQEVIRHGITLYERQSTESRGLA